MIDLFIQFSFLSAGIAALATLVMCVGTVAHANYVASGESMRIISAQIDTCRTASPLFCVLAWLVASSMEWGDCLYHYARIGKACLYLGFAWLGLAFATILFCILLGVIGRGRASVTQLYQARNNSFILGGVFLLFSALLTI